MLISLTSRRAILHEVMATIFSAYIKISNYSWFDTRCLEACLLLHSGIVSVLSLSILRAKVVAWLVKFLSEKSNYEIVFAFLLLEVFGESVGALSWSFWLEPLAALSLILSLPSPPCPQTHRV